MSFHFLPLSFGVVPNQEGADVSVVIRDVEVPSARAPAVQNVQDAFSLRDVEEQHFLLEFVKAIAENGNLMGPIHAR